MSIQFGDLDRWRQRGELRAWRVWSGRHGLSDVPVLELWANNGRQMALPLTGEGSVLLQVHDALRSFTPEDWENLPPLAERLKTIQEAFTEAALEREKEIASHPDNGKTGWWIVDGVRHSAYVRASSAAEAIQKAELAGAVQEWEHATADFHAEDMGDVIAC